MKKFPAHIFREYDIRGVVDTELSNDFAHALGRAYARLVLPNNNALKPAYIGWDCRLTSPSYAKSLAKGMSEEGLPVILSGIGPTPQLYYAVFSSDCCGGIQVTGSHNPPDMNGFKILIGHETLSGAQIQQLKETINALPEKPSIQAAKITECDARAAYVRNLIHNSRGQLGSRKLKVVVDAGNGVGGLVGPEVLRELGVEVVELFCDLDGRFPNHHPDPTELKNIKALIQMVKKTKADFGIGWDGDADRIGVVDEKGQPIFGDMLLLMYAREIMKSVTEPTIIGDVKCSSLLFDTLASEGAKPVMWKTGHSLIKAKLRETGAELAGEMSGHIFFKHRYFGFDDAIYAAIRFVELVSHSRKPVSKLLSELPDVVSTPEIRVDCPEGVKFRIFEFAKTAFPEFKVDTLDGVRLTFEHGWGIVRPSNTQPVLVMRFEATSKALLKQYQELVTERIATIRSQIEAGAI